MSVTNYYSSTTNSDLRQILATHISTTYVRLGLLTMRVTNQLIATCAKYWQRRYVQAC